MQETAHTTIPEDEIDLRAAFRKTGSFAGYLWWLFRTNVKTTLVFIVLAVLLAVAVRYGIAKTYRSSFIIRPIDVHEHFHQKVLKDIQLLLSNRDYATLASELKLPDATAQAISDIQVFSPTLKASSDSANYSEVTIATTDYNLFLPIQNSLLNYLETNPYFLKVKQLQQNQVIMALDQVNKDLPQLDSLKDLQLRNYDKLQQSPQHTLLMNELMDPTAVYRMAIDRLNKKSNLMAQQVFSENFQLIKSCVVAKRASWPPRFIKLCLVFIPCSLLLCLLFLHIQYRSRERQKQL